MITAIQELIQWTNQYEGKMISANQVVLKAYKMLEKEKEQIIEANIAGMEFIPVDPNKYQQDAEQYYNQTYNQKQHIIDIMKADEDDGLYNQNES
jgi:hypothetical protein